MFDTRCDEEVVLLLWQLARSIDMTRHDNVSTLRGARSLALREIRRSSVSPAHRKREHGRLSAHSVARARMFS